MMPNNMGKHGKSRACRRRRRDSLTRAVALAGLLAALPIARATEIDVHFHPCPEVMNSGVKEISWGVRRGGVEIGTGRMDFATVRDTHRATITTDQALQPGDEAEVWWCYNTDALRGYVPSAGESVQRGSARHDAGGWRATLTSEACVPFAPERADDLLTIHYHRGDDDYTSVGLWTWDEHQRRAPDENELFPVGRDDYGLIFQLDVRQYGSAADTIGLLPRRLGDWQHKDGGDRTWSPGLGRTIYLVQDDSAVYTEKPDVTPKVRRVTLDADHHLTVRFSHRLPVADWTEDKFKVATSAGEQLHVRAVYPFKHRGDRCAMYSLEVAERFEYPEKAYALDVEGFGTHNVAVGHIVRDASRFYDPDARLGVTYTPEQTTFRVFAPGALTAQVVLADEVTGDAGLERHAMRAGKKGIWELTLPGDHTGKLYAYTLGGLGFDPDVEIADPYAVCMQGRSPRSLIVNLPATDPPGFREQSYDLPDSPVDAVIYEMHVRDFTIAANSGVDQKGKYLGLTEGGTTLPDDPAIATGIDHLVELGVTHVQIMPIQDFDNHEHAEDSYNWGYMPVHFNSPDGWFAQEIRGPGRIRELKAAIQAFHQRGIGVILDVVYNHTADWAPFEQLVPGYYFRLTDAGNFSNGSGCGNEFASEAPMARKYILDSVRYWVEEYRVDGFRFDLMGLIDLETMRLMKADLEKINPNILIYGEPWTGGHTPLKPVTTKEQTRGTGVLAFNDHFRDAIKGGRDGGGPGFIQAGADVGKIVKGLMGGIHDWAQDPVDAIAYFECHDNLTAWDKLLQSVPDGSDELKRRMMRLAALTLLTAQGMPFIHSGQEFCRSKQGHHNSYNQPDEINQIDWQRKKTYADVYAYHRGLIALRKAHPAFRLRTRAEVERRVHFDSPPSPFAITYRIDGRDLPGESAETVLVLLNGSAEPVAFPLGEGQWGVYVDGSRAGADRLTEAQGKITVPARSGAVLMR
jgi:pullulanase